MKKKVNVLMSSLATLVIFASAAAANDLNEQNLDALRGASFDTIEYTLDPGSVEMVVEMDPNNYGFRTRNHRMTLSADLDFILRGRSALHYDFRFFEYLSLGILAGVDSTKLSLLDRSRSQQATPAPDQLTIFGGVTAKWRLTEWYMRTSISLEPSVILGHMWQTYALQDSKHWRFRPGLFFVIDRVFDSGFSLSARLGAEFPIDFGRPNAIREVVEPLAVFGFGIAI